MSEAYHRKYRPQSFDEMLGHEIALKSINKVIKKGTSQSFILTGPSGVGKTTAARIIAKMVECEEQNIIEIDAATHTGIESIRNVTKDLIYSGFGSKPNKIVIVDEAHRLSAAAWNSLLKNIEEPPEHVYWALCTTEESKIPATIKTRCTICRFGPVEREKIEKLVKRVIKKEELKVKDDVFDLIVKKAQGSPRQALVNLAQCAGAKDRQEAAVLLECAEENQQVIDLCRWLVSGKNINWNKARSLLNDLKDQNAESVRITVMNYLAAVALNAKNDRFALHVVDVMNFFREPYTSTDGIGPLVSSVGNYVFSDNG